MTTHEHIGDLLAMLKGGLLDIEEAISQKNATDILNAKIYLHKTLLRLKLNINHTDVDFKSKQIINCLIELEPSVLSSLEFAASSLRTNFCHSV